MCSYLSVEGFTSRSLINIYGSLIPVVEKAKVLDLLFDKKLSFIPHIKALKAKCLKALDVVKVLSNASRGGDRWFFLICIDLLSDQNLIMAQLYMVLHENPISNVLTPFVIRVYVSLLERFVLLL